MSHSPRLDVTVRGHAATRPDEVAFIDPVRTVTWAQLNDEADRVAGMLQRAGVEPGNRVGWLGPNSTAYPITLLGIWRAGAAVAGLNWRMPPEGVAASCAVIDVDHVVADHRFADAAAQAPSRTGVTVVEPGAEPWNSEEPIVRARSVGPDDEAIIYFTSGSTGTPKAVPLTHFAATAALQYADAHEYDESSRALIIPPVFHAAGSIWTNYGMDLGITQVYTEDPTPAGIVSALRDHRISHVILVPTLIHTLVEELKRTGESLPDLKHVAYGTSPITQSLLGEAMRILGCDFSQVYGLSEGGGALSFLWSRDHALDGPHTHRLKSAGKPGAGVEIEIRDMKGQSVPAGETGGLWVRGPSLTHGYIGNDEATKRSIVDGWLNTGDVARLDEDGYLYIEGRADDMILTGGENVHPQAVEEVLATMPGVQECAVYGIPDEHWGERVTAAVVTDAGADIDEEKVRAHCRQHLAGYQVPRTVLVLPELPRTATGKVMRTRLVEQTVEAVAGA